MAEDEGQLELTRSQLLIWTGQQLHPSAPLYNQAFTFELTGIDSDRLAAAFRRLIETCDVLRTVLESSEAETTQRILPTLDFELPVIDVSTADDPAVTAREIAVQRCQEILPPDRPLLDAALLHLGGEHWLLYFCQHHVMTDAWAVALLFRRLTAIYAHHSETPQPGPSFASYARFEREQRTNPPASVLQHWRRFKDREPPRLYGEKAPLGTASVRLTVDLGSEQSQALKDLARRREVAALTVDLGLFQVFATLLFAYQYRVSGQTSLTLGAPAHNRSTAELRQTPGLLTEVFPLSVDATPDDSFLSLLGKVREETYAFLRHATPGASDARHNKAFCAVLNFIRGSFDDFEGVPVRTEWLHPGHHDREHPLRLHVHDFADTGTLCLQFDLNEEVFNEGRRPLVVGHFMVLLKAMLDDWQLPIQQVDLLSEEERARQLQGFQPVPQSFVQARPSVLESFAAVAHRAPHAIALCCADRRVSYGELRRDAKTLATRLGERQKLRIGLLMERSPEVILGILGVLEAGGAYVPLDPRWPRKRLQWVLEDAGVELVLSSDSVDDFQSIPSLTLSDMLHSNASDSAGQRAAKTGSFAAPEDPAYLIYTSGSTGTPKGVVISHGALANYVGWAVEHYGNASQTHHPEQAPSGGMPGLTMPLFSPLTFDLTVTSVFVPLTSGGSVMIYPETSEQADLAFLDVVRDDAVDIIKLTPSHLTLLGGAADKPHEPSRVSQLIFGGEALTREAALRARDFFGSEVVVHNEYGPTEATVGSLVHVFDPDLDLGSTVPIGRPIDGLRAYILDQARHPVPEGVPAELYLSGRGLAAGYLGRPELTAGRFTASPFEAGERLYRTGDIARFLTLPGGTLGLEYLGREDQQVKVRGARIELGEIEAALGEHPEISSCAAAVIAAESPPTRSSDGDLRHCLRCGLPSSHPAARIADDGICGECHAFEKYRHKVAGYFRSEDDLKAILDTAPHSASYDCLALLSGGKDSTYVLCRLVDMGYRVLSFTLDNGFISEQAKNNIRRVTAELGVDHVFGTTPAMNRIFVDSLERFSNVCQGCFKTIYTLAIGMAKERSIPFVITGLSRGQLFETRLTKELFTELDFDPDRIDRTVLEARKAYHRADDAISRLLDVSIFGDDQLFEQVHLLDFFRYCDVSLDAMLETLATRVPWIRPSDTGRSTNCLINDLGISVHKKERGFHNYAHPYAWDVRMGHKTRQAALDELDDEIDASRIDTMLEEIGYQPRQPEAGGTRLIAYYTPGAAAQGGRLSSAELRDFLRHRLPDFMVPSTFVPMTELPRTAHGKIDREALEPPEHQRRSDASFLAPRNEIERALASLWTEALPAQEIGVRDNFFELGGDSIMAIQIVARGLSRGLKLSPEMLFDTLTVEKLAQALGEHPARSTVVNAAEQQEPAGPAELLPAQLWHLDAPRSLHHALELRMPEDLDTERFENALKALVARHDALRLRFQSTSNGWSAECVADVSPRVHYSRQAREQEMEQALFFDLDEAFKHGEPASQGDRSLLGALVVHRNGQPCRLLLVAHHLVVDAVSWPILLEDLSTLYLQLADREDPKLDAPATSVRHWAAALRAHGHSASVQAEAAFWLDQLPRVRRLVATPNAARGTRELFLRLSQKRSQELLTEVPKSGRIRVHHVLLAALTAALHETSGDETIYLMLEGHGRDLALKPPGRAALDASRLVGWLTSLYPLALEAPASASGPPAWLDAAQKSLSALPSTGASYGALRYHGPPPIRRQLAAREEARVLFNYLGNTDTTASSSSLFKPSCPLRLVRDDDAAPRFALEVNALVSEGEVRIEWTFDPRYHLEEDVRRQAASQLRHLEALIEHCLTSKPKVSARDFPLANLDASKLGKLSAALARKVPG